MLEHMDVVVPFEGADKGKVFRITPMSVWKAEKWGWRALGILSRAGMDLPDVGLSGNMLVVAAQGLEALMKADFEEAEPLLDEMIACIAILPDPANYPDLARTDIQNDVQELKTIPWLRNQVLKAHTGFSLDDVLLLFRRQTSE